MLALRLRLSTHGLDELIVSVAAWLLAPDDAEIETFTTAGLVFTVLTGNVADSEPAGTTTEVDTIAAAGLPDERFTRTPLAPAGDPSVTVPVTLAPAVTVEGFNVKLAIVPDMGAPKEIVAFTAGHPFITACTVEPTIVRRLAICRLTEPEVCPCGMLIVPSVTAFRTS